MAAESKICHYLDMPVQHASDSVLKRMGRKTSRQGLLDIIEKLRQRIPDIALRTTLLVGFPGETEEDFETLYEFVDMVGFERLGVFPYSPEEDTPAVSRPDQVPEEEKERYDKKRLCRVTGGGMAVLTVLLAVMALWEDTLPAEFAGFFAAAAVAVAAAIVILGNTVCRRK